MNQGLQLANRLEDTVLRVIGRGEGEWTAQQRKVFRAIIKVLANHEQVVNDFEKVTISWDSFEKGILSNASKGTYGTFQRFIKVAIKSDPTVYHIIQSFIRVMEESFCSKQNVICNSQAKLFSAVYHSMLVELESKANKTALVPYTPLPSSIRIRPIKSNNKNAILALGNSTNHDQFDCGLLIVFICLYLFSLIRRFFKKHNRTFKITSKSSNETVTEALLTSQIAALVQDNDAIREERDLLFEQLNLTTQNLQKLMADMPIVVPLPYPDTHLQ